ncbi:rNA polymerase sigma factor [Clostridium sp. CAG:594]|nr:rNA polymerase sigma factor [Clostridium sp. CAG:594]
MITIAKHKVEITGINTSEIKVLTDKEKEELFIRLKNGDMTAKDELANGNLKLVLSILRKYQNRCDNMDDLFQIGCVGLMKAIDNFDLSHNVKFSTYAVPLILGEIRRYLRDNSNLRISRSIKDLAYKILKVKEEYFMDNGKELSNSEVAKKLGCDEIDVIIALDAMRDPISMFEPIYNDGGDTIYLEDQLESKKDKISNWDITISLKNAINELKDKERKIITERFLIGKTQMEIAEEIGISQAQVSRLEKCGIEDLRKMIM